MLWNDVYTGTAKWGVKQCGKFANGKQEIIRVEDAHEALIGREDFARVDAGIAMRRPTVMHPRTALGPYLLSGLLYCAGCGAVFIGHGSNKGAHHYYTCRTKQAQTAKACAAKNFNRELVESTVIDAIRGHVLRPDHFAGLIRDVQVELRTQAAGAVDERAAVATQLAEVNRKLERLYEAVEGGLIPHAQLAPRIAHQSGERESLTARLAALPTTERNPILAIAPEEVAAWVANMRATFDRGNIDERRALLRAWVKRITADGDRLTIEYTFPTVGVDDGGPPNGAAQVIRRSPVVLGTVVDENLGAQGWFAAPKMNEGVLPWWRVLPTVNGGSGRRSRAAGALYS